LMRSASATEVPPNFITTISDIARQDIGALRDALKASAVYQARRARTTSSE
jgi:hypothetical protein